MLPIDLDLDNIAMIYSAQLRKLPLEIITKGGRIK